MTYKVYQLLELLAPFPESIAERNEQNEDNRHPDKSLPTIAGDKSAITGDNELKLHIYYGLLENP